MLSLDLFRQFGLFIQPNFLDNRSCIDLLTKLQTVDGQPALVLPRQDRQILTAQVDPYHRQTEQLQVPSTTTAWITAQLHQLQPTLARHFNLELTGIQNPLFYRYSQGSFFGAHCDRTLQSDAPPFLQARQVSVILFLNEQTPDPQPGCYCGGSLVFYGLIDPSQWQTHGFPFPGQPGLLVAFRSDLWHEVQAVTAGERYTLVSWYT
jgi:SM-20-related protein